MTFPLHMAVKASSASQVRCLLVDEPGEAARRDEHKNLPIHCAAKHGDPDIVRALVTAAPQCLKETTLFHDTALHIAARHARLHAVGILLEACSDASRAANKKGDVPLHTVAASRRNARRYDTFLLLYDADPEQAARRNDALETPLHVAARSGCAHICAFLAERHPDALTTANVNGLVPLHIAVAQYVEAANAAYAQQHDGMDCARATLHALLVHTSQRAPVGTVQELHELSVGEQHQRQSIVHIAAFLGHADLVRLMLRIDPGCAHTLDGEQVSPIHLAAMEGHADIVEMLLHVAPHLARALTDDMATPLHHAASGRGDEAAGLLVQAAPETAQFLTVDACSPMLYAIEANNLGALGLLLDVAPGMAAVPDAFGCCPVWHAAFQGSYHAIAMLLRVAPQTASQTGDWGMNALHVAASRSYFEAVGELVRHDPGLALLPCENGDNAVHCALKPTYGIDEDAFKEDDLVAPVLEALLRVAPSLATQTTTFGSPGNTPLHIAAALGMEACALELLHVAPSTAQMNNDNGYSALEVAMLHGHTDVARVLVELPTDDPTRIFRIVDEHSNPADPESAEVWRAALEAHVPLSRACWDLVPVDLACLWDVLPTVVRRGTAVDLRQLVGRLPQADYDRVTTFLCCLHRNPVHLPLDIVLHVLAMSV